MLVAFYLSLWLFAPGICKGQFLDTIYSRGNNAKISYTSLGDTAYLFANIKNINPRLYEYTLINYNGEILDTLSLNYPIPGYSLDNCRSCLHFKERRTYSAYTNFTSLDSGFVILSKLTFNPLDTIETMRYYVDRSIYTGEHAWSMAFDTDSTFLVSGYVARWVQQPDSLLKYDLFLTKFDTALNVVWETTVADGIYGRRYGPIGTDIVVDSYGRILVTGNAFFYPFLEIGFASRFDSQGNNLWYKEYPGNMGMSGMYCVDNEDGTYQYVQNWWTRPQGDINDLIVGRMDTMGNILTGKRFGKVQRMQFAQDLIKTKDGNFYISGIGYYANFHSFGFKFTPQGDSLWYRTYHHDDSLDLAYVENFQEDADSNLVHFGYHGDNVNPRPGNGIFSWLYRTDQYGCIFKDCQLSREELATLPQLSLYPNPAPGGRFFIELPTASKEAPAVLEIYGSAGALLESHSLGRSSGRLSVQTDLSPGVYFCLLRAKDGKEIGVAKLMREE